MMRAAYKMTYGKTSDALDKCMGIRRVKDGKILRMILLYGGAGVYETDTECG